MVTEFVSLDGVIEDPGGARTSSTAAGASSSVGATKATGSSSTRPLSSEALLLGRVTYEGFAAAWPSREGEFADKFNSMPKYVVSSTLKDPEWNNSTVIAGDIAEEVSKQARAAATSLCTAARPSSRR